MELGIESGLRTWMTSEIVQFLKYPLQVQVAHVNGIREKLEDSCPYSLCTSLRAEGAGTAEGADASRAESVRVEKHNNQYQLVHVIHRLDPATKEENYALRVKRVLQTMAATRSWSKPALVDMLSRYVYHGGVLRYNEDDYLLEYLV
jgi:hypothetical protein